MVGVMPAPHTPPDDIAALRAALAAERLARREAEARASGAEAMVAHLKLLIARLKRDKYGASSERGRKLIDSVALTSAWHDEAFARSRSGGEAEDPEHEGALRRGVRRAHGAHLPLRQHRHRLDAG